MGAVLVSAAPGEWRGHHFQGRRFCGPSHLGAF